MIKIWYLTVIIWNGGQGPTGVMSNLWTYSSLERCNMQKAFITDQVSKDWSGHMFKIEDCEAVDLKKADIAI